MIAGDQRTARELHRDITAVGGCDFKLSVMRELVIIASVTQEDLIHNKLRRCPHILADIEWKIRVRLVYDLDHLVEIICRLLILEGLDSSKESKHDPACSLGSRLA